jgi:hypothetical protein
MSKHSGLRGLIGNLDKVKRETLGDQLLDPKVAMLRAWQSQRLARTYQDLLDLPRYRPACQFFLDDIYAARDFSQRDHDIAQMYEFTRRFVPDAMLRPLAITVELHQLSADLDRRLLDVLIDQLGVVDSITPDQYAAAYRLCDNYAERVRQIELIQHICERLDGIVRSPITGPTLSVARRPLRGAGYVEMVEFLERGYHAFRRMHGSHHFRKTIRRRELAILDRIYARAPDPFAIDLMPISSTHEETEPPSATFDPHSEIASLSSRQTSDSLD